VRTLAAHRGRLLGACALLAFVGVLPGPSAAASRQSQVSFRTPSGNISCVLAARGADASVQCWMLSAACLNREIGMKVAYAWVLPGLPGGKPKRVCPGDFVPATTMLGYGSALHRGNVTCRSLRSGLRCERRGHGFLLSRERQTTW
jgi:hypothetical protein